jgi:hypothetical protein
MEMLGRVRERGERCQNAQELTYQEISKFLTIELFTKLLKIIF